MLGFFSQSICSRSTVNVNKKELVAFRSPHYFHLLWLATTVLNICISFGNKSLLPKKPLIFSIQFFSCVCTLTPTTSNSFPFIKTGSSNQFHNRKIRNDAIKTLFYRKNWFLNLKCWTSSLPNMNPYQDWYSTANASRQFGVLDSGLATTSPCMSYLADEVVLGRGHQRRRAARFPQSYPWSQLPDNNPHQCEVSSRSTRNFSL